MLVDAIKRTLSAHRFRYAHERELQRGIAQVLAEAGLEVRREASLGEAGTIDLLVGTLGIEIKVKGSRAEVTRQVHRYLQHSALAGLLLVTTRAPLAQLPSAMCGKPLYTHHLVSGAF